MSNLINLRQIEQSQYENKKVGKILHRYLEIRKGFDRRLSIIEFRDGTHALRYGEFDGQDNVLKYVYLDPTQFDLKAIFSEHYFGSDYGRYKTNGVAFANPYNINLLPDGFQRLLGDV